jgi:cysteine desulfurase
VPGAYLDHAATTPVRPEVVEAMLPYLSGSFGNPSGSHAVARAARRALEDARDVLAGTLGAEPGAVVFTASGTEADNLAVLGVHGRRGGRVVCSAIEHHAVLNSVIAAGGETTPVAPDGVLDLAALAGLLSAEGGDGVTIVSVMLVNNEVGTVQPLGEVAELLAEHAPTAVLHTDAVQAFPWLDVAASASGADLVSVSAHKFGGPPGVGALVVRQRARGSLSPLLYGGGQERELRPGTQNVPAIVGMAVAAAMTADERAETAGRVARLRDRLADRLLADVPGVTETVPREGRIAGSCHLRFEGVEAEELLLLLDRSGVSASSGSACASGALEPSHVLLAMGLSAGEARTGVRFSLGRTTTEAEIEAALAVIPPAVAALRAGDDPA